ncbi:hypothetical protein VA7868_03316 [Vibrio aerogenes CECT 7868]|uniref:N-acetyltransferase domain-containing protein n=1 Tax=Vibrio aerogenes CECT 7868 TaxID=1216006 RepID=A0A1M5ZWI2_9VIBR|nr:GNAT family N-acetyltransferase [Vibrio aerogenes]SHI28389.1 hypothetical protein VA7868_03316 [Vibrio aerogenes CECT 7868]
MSSKIILRPLSLDELEVLVCKDVVTSRQIDFSKLVISEVQRSAMQIKIEKMKQIKKEFHHWFTYWLMISKQSSKAMGLVGFKGIGENGVCEIGYGISKQFERNQYTSEAVKLLVHWAFQHNYCKQIVAHGVQPDNYGSQRVLVRNGFEKVSESAEGFSYRLSRQHLKKPVYK